ncbi:ArnT family glycosyltransferase [Sandaracinus amylolyticus]|uniref:ArnT family glycosyltransferase n=1 Tax=Sandaracinus amylolyticus TaxID=927083 RepID=UPI001F478384|nr:glycosyltransferase family 39 protein [Sandaracinus amylolyticus]UJR79934.1 Hypothetical protein I5071_19740 [Sandaracinus amylolyticus]
MRRTPALALLARLAPLLLAAAALASIAGALSIFDGVTRPTRANGFERLSSGGSHCDFDDPAWARNAVRSFDVEPFAAEQEHPEQCVSWRAWWAVARPTRLELEIESDDDGFVLLDERRFVDHPGAHARSTRSETREIEPGVHRVEVRWINRGGGGYLRVRMQDRRDPYMAGVLPLDRDAFFVSRFDAERALESGSLARRAPEHARDFALLLALGGLFTWLAVRAWRRRDDGPLRRLAVIDVAIGVGVTLLALLVRSTRIADTDLAWDELWYWNAGEQQVRNALLGDWSAEAYRFNHEHPPITKWIYGLGGALGGIDGARHVGAVLSAVSVGLVYGLGRVLFDRRAGVAAALLMVSMPHVVAHGRLVGHETIVVFFWCANLLALAVWLRSVRFGASYGDRLEHGDSLAAFVGGLLFFPGLLSRLTFLWITIPIAWALVWARRREIARGTWPIPITTLIGGAIGLGICIALWPWIHTDPAGHLRQTFGHWGGRLPTEYFLGERIVGPPFSYYPVLFVVTTPLLAVITGAIGIVIGLRRKALRAASVLILVALLAPFLQGLSSFRQDLARYVVQCWPMLALFAGIALSRAGAALASRVGKASRTTPAIALAPAAAMALYGLVELRSVEPFPLDYYSELVGGPGGVAERQLFDVSWWAEGPGHAVAWLNEHAREGTRVRIDTSNWDVRPRLRDDLVEVPFRSRVPAEYVVTNYHLYGDPPPPGCERIHHVDVRGAPLASVWECEVEGR